MWLHRGAAGIVSHWGAAVRFAAFAGDETNTGLDSGAALDSRVRLRRAARLVPLRLGAEGVGKEFDEGTRLSRQEATMRVNRVNGHVAVEGIARAEGNERAVLELLPDVPGRFERHAEPCHRPFLEHLPVVAGVASRDAHRSGLAFGSLVVPAHAEVVRRQAIVAEEILRRVRGPMAAQVVGAGAHDAPIWRQLACRERG